MKNINIPWIRLSVELEVISRLLNFEQDKGSNIKDFIENALLCRELWLESFLFKKDSEQFKRNPKLYKEKSTALKNNAEQKCENCSSKGKTCIYNDFFPKNVDEVALWTIVPPINERCVYNFGEIFSFEIILAGRLAEKETVKWLIAALASAHPELQKMVQIGRWQNMKADNFGLAQLKNVYIWQNKNWQNIYPNSKTEIKPEYYAQLPENNEVNWEIVFQTPLCRNKTGEEIPSYNIQKLIAASENRIKMILGSKTSLFTQEEVELIDKLSTKKEEIYHTPPHKIPESKKTKEYIEGKIEVSIIPDFVLEILFFGALFHVGKDIKEGRGSFILRPY